MTRVGNWMQTYSGRAFWPLDPWVKEINLIDIAHALSNMCRYGGHCNEFYSVAEHSVLLSHAAPAEFKLWALLHDAAEAYLVDVPRPIKSSLGGYAQIEDRLMHEIAIKYSLGSPGDRQMPPQVKELDNRILVDEKAQNMKPGLDWGEIDMLEPLGVVLQFWTPKVARDRFLEQHWRLTAA